MEGAMRGGMEENDKVLDEVIREATKPDEKSMKKSK
jgi:hypothetical protein